MYRSRLLAGAAACALLCAASAAGAAETPYFRFKSLAPDAAAISGSGGGGSTDTGGTGTGGTGDTTPDTTPTTLPPAQRLNLSVRYRSYQPAQVGTDSLAGFVDTDDGTAPFTYSATGLPQGIGVSCSDSDCYTGSVSGSPAQAGFFPVTMSVTDSLGNAGSATFQLPVGKPDGQGSAFLNDLTLSVTQPYYGPGATYLPGPDYGNAVTWSLSPDSAPLPPGLTLSSSPVVNNGTTLFDYNSATPTQVGTYPGIILRATPQSGTPVDSAPATITVKALALSATSSPQLVRILPGDEFAGRQTLKGLVTYGSWTSQENASDLGNSGVSWQLVPENGSQVPDGLSWDNDNLTFRGTPTTPGQTGTFHVAATVPGSPPASSPSFTVEVKRELNVVLNQPECRYNEGRPAMGMFPAVPAGLECEDTFYSKGDEVPVPGGMPAKTKVVVFGGDNPTCKLSAGSALPPTMTLNADCTFSGTPDGATDGSTQADVSIDVTAAGLTSTVGPFHIKVSPNDAFMPRLIIVNIPHQMDEAECTAIFQDMSHYPYSNVIGTNVPSYMSVSPDGKACPTTAMTQSQYNAAPKNVPGKLKATDGNGKTYEVDVTYGGMQLN